ncbi:hypothetical protein VNO77_33635 [Canavalia gladiata]|uniref:Multidrug and toxic compound extrusion protein n=1 Tax=Canavalia gladiata TaxID=3824 RepID=A0AAN9KF26_CANGL
METPLVIQRFTSEADYLGVKSFNDVRYVLWTETVKIWKLAFPMALSGLFQFLTNSLTSIYAGHLGGIELSSISVYQGVISSIYFYLLFGMSSALATLCGQAFGAGKIQSTCIYVQRSWIILVITIVILLPIFVYATPILKFLGQEKGIADLAGKYSIQIIPHIFSFAITLPIQIFLQAQSKVKVIMCISFVVLLMQNGLLYLFINVCGWGTIGLAMANNITGWGYAVALVVYAIGWCKEGWNGWSMMAFKDLWTFTKLCLASSVMTCLEQWYATCIVLLIGQLDNPVITVGSYSIWLALDTAPWNKCGHESLLLGIIFMTVIFLSKDNFAIIFTNSVVIGSGWQVMVAYVNLVCYYIVGLPIGIFLGFKQQLGVKGLWVGALCGRTLQLLVLLLITWKTNWTKEVEQTASRLQIWSSSSIQKDITESVI